LKKEDGRFSAVKAISGELEGHFASVWDRKECVVATLLDPRFKDVYLQPERMDEYKEWLISEAESLQKIDVIISY
jgi:hypothetical protein